MGARGTRGSSPATSVAVATGSPNTIFIPRGTLFQQYIDPELPAVIDAEDPQDHLESLLRSIQYRRVTDAKLLFVRQDVANAPIVHARTDQRGRIVGTDGAALSFQPCAPYAGFWSTDAEVVDMVEADLQQDMDSALASNSFFFFSSSLVGDNTYSTGPARRCTDRIMSVLGACVDSRRYGRFWKDILFLLYGYRSTENPTRRQMIDGFHIPSKLPNTAGDVRRERPILVARSPALSAVVFVELIQCVTRILTNSMQHWVAIEETRKLIEHAVNGTMLPKLHDRLRTYRGTMLSAPRPSDHRAEMAYEWWEYIRDAAKVAPRIGDDAVEFRKLFYRAATVHVTDDDWKDAAHEIDTKLKGPRHPAWNGGSLTWKPAPHENDVLAYFDAYRFGHRHNAQAGMPVQRAHVDRTLEARTDIDGSMAELTALSKATLAERASYPLFLGDLASHVADEEERGQWHARYLETALALDFRWWETLPSLDGTHSAEAKRLLKYARWTISGGKLIFGKIVGGFLSAHIERYNAVFGGSSKHFEGLFFSLSELDTALGGRPVSRIFDGDTTITLDPAMKSISVSSPKGSIIVDDFDVRVMSAVESEAFDGTTRLRNVPTRLEVTVKAQPRAAPQFPAWIGAIADVVSLGTALSSLSSDLEKKSSTLVMLGLGQKAMGTASSLATVVYALRRAKRPEIWDKLGKVAGVTGNLLMVIDGARIVFFDHGLPDPHVDGYVLAYAEHTKGLLMLTAGALSAALTVIGSSLALPVGVVGGVLLLGLEIGVYIWKGPDNELEELEHAVEAALDKELGKDRQGHQGRSCWSLAQLDDLVTGVAEIDGGICVRP